MHIPVSSVAHTCIFVSSSDQLPLLWPENEVVITLAISFCEFSFICNRDALYYNIFGNGRQLIGIPCSAHIQRRASIGHSLLFVQCVGDLASQGMACAFVSWYT